MAIRLRRISDGTECGYRWAALCAAEYEAKPRDIYLDDNQHHALTAKFEADFKAMGFWKEPHTDRKPIPCPHDYTNPKPKESVREVIRKATKDGE